jgi:hypothetical protein
MVRPAVLLLAFVAAGCELVVGNETRQVADSGFDVAPFEAGADASGMDADPPPTDATAPLDATDPSEATPSDVSQPLDAVPPLDATAEGGPTFDASCGPTCLSAAVQCATTCNQTESTCEAGCNGGGKSACIQQCQNTDATCKATCQSTCTGCMQGVGCPNASQCAIAVGP